jgi:GNAT superfamily N-acetyltransferase
MAITVAVTDDIPALVQLINSAYRGEVSTNGWTTEAHLIAGSERIDDIGLHDLMQQPTAVILKHTNTNGIINGSVYLNVEAGKLYLGLLCVTPFEQAQGVGKQLLAAAEAYALNIGVSVIFMSVIPQRTELVAWYNRHGYSVTGLTKPFTGPERFGKPTTPIEFIILEKQLVETE